MLWEMSHFSSKVHSFLKVSFGILKDSFSNFRYCEVVEIKCALSSLKQLAP